MQTKSKKNENEIGGEMKGAALGLLAIVIMLAMYAAAIYSNPETADHSGFIITIIIVIGSLICGRITAKQTGENNVKEGIVSGAILSLVVIILALACYYGRVDIAYLGKFVLITLCGSAIGARVRLCKSNKKLRKGSAKGKR